MQIIKSKFTGFCQGVSTSIEAVMDAKAKFNNVWTSSIIVHNKLVASTLDVKSLDNDVQGIDFSSIQGDSSAVVISAHGFTYSFINELKARNINIINATCPVVQQNIDNANKTKCDIIYIGNKNHSECRFFLDNVQNIGLKENKKRNILVIQNFKELDIIESNILLSLIQPQIYVQTTFSHTEYSKIVSYLKDLFSQHGKIITCFKGVCPDCLNRRKDVQELAHKVDAFVVVGDNLSSNAKELCNIASSILGSNVYLVQSDNDSLLPIIKKKCKNKKVGLISCASSSTRIFNNILKSLQV